MSATDATPGAAPHGADASAQHAAALVRGIVWIRRLVAQYPPGHSLIADKVAETHAIAARELARCAELQLDIVNAALLLDGRPVQQDSAAAQAVQELTELGIHSIRLRAGLREDELLSTAEFLHEYRSRGDQDARDLADMSVAAQLERRDVQHVSLARLVPLDTRWYARQWPKAPPAPLDPDYEQALLIAQSAFDNVGSGRDLDRAAVRELVQLLIERVARSNAALGQILAVKQYENLTYAHSVNVSMLSLLIGRKIGLDEPAIGFLVEAALLHDIGKTRIPLDILRKPGALSPSERRQIELHAMYGAEILVGVDGLAALTPTVALEHHRTTRGAGYPDLGDGVIPHPMSQIVSVADTYEAITGARSYKDPTPPDRACLILARVSGTQLNAALVKAFVNTITFFPIGSFVRTSLDEIAVVTATSEHDPLHPVVAILDPGMGAIRDVVDTSRRSGGAYERHVIETVAPPAGAPELTAVLDHAPAAR